MSVKEIIDLNRSRTVTWFDPGAFSDLAQAMTGLEFLNAMKDGKIPHPPICQLVNFRLVEVETGHVAFEMVPDESHYNPFGVSHGGITSTLLDSAAACAVHTTLPLGLGYNTIDIKVNFIRPVTIQTGPMRCEGKIINVGNRIATAQAKMADKNGKLYAYGISTCLIFLHDMAK